VSFVDIPGPSGTLEGLYWEVAAPVAAAVVCHPHPLQGGTMNNNVTYRLADAFRQARVATMRFNFRGVGRSAGTYDEGVGEVDDAAAALDHLAAQAPGVPLFSAGFSFGSRVALKLAVRDARVAKTVAAGVAVSLFDMDFVRELAKPKALIQADHDEFAPLEQARAFFASLAEPKALFVVENSDHLATGRLAAFEAQARLAVAWLLGA
jgi:alpha/beta superfamily hydrolase